MRNLILALTFAGVAASPLAAQTNDPDDEVKGSGKLPAAWHARLDRPNASLADVKFVTMGTGFHATMGPAAILYNPANTASGEYRARVTMTQTKAPRHPEAYGLFVGGRNLDTDAQDYLYFLVRQDGKFLVKHRAGAEIHTLFDWTEHTAVKKADAEGKATNTLEIDVRAAGVRFLVNGTEVAKLDRVPQMNTDGIVGLRVNHNLDVHIEGFAIERGHGRH